jgi:hypothetical protein
VVIAGDIPLFTIWAKRVGKIAQSGYRNLPIPCAAPRFKIGANAAGFIYSDSILNIFKQWRELLG